MKDHPKTTDNLVIALNFGLFFAEINSVQRALVTNHTNREYVKRESKVSSLQKKKLEKKDKALTDALQ